MCLACGKTNKKGYQLVEDRRNTQGYKFFFLESQHKISKLKKRLEDSQVLMEG